MATELRGGKYTLLRLLGEGSQGSTWEGRDDGAPATHPSPAKLASDFDAFVKRAERGHTPSPRGLVAVKCFRLDRAKAWKDVELAEREARTLASLDHPRLPRYIEHFEEDGALYLVMEKIEGESLASIRARRATLAPGEVERMIREVGEALAYLHGRAPPVVHRDVKPGNVIRRPDGSFALVDFGAVRDTLKPAGGSTVVGTFGFMAPEQFQGRASSRSDLYGLGATAITMLTGTDPEELPHEGLGIDVARAVPDATPRPLREALRRMLVADPDRRVQTMAEVVRTLEAAPAPSRSPRPAPVPAPPPPPVRLMTRKERRRVEREAKRARKALERARRAPFVPRVVGRLGLSVAIVAVWLTVGMVVPALLAVLSLVFGPALRRAASACVSAARRSTAAMGRASGWLGGRRDEAVADAAPPEATLRTRVAAGAARVRVGPADDLGDDREEAHEIDEDADTRGPRARRFRGG